MTTLTPDLAARFAALTLGHVTREFPHKLDHVLNGPEDALRPRDLHPLFYGSFDWHSCVHGWWQLMRLAALYPDATFASDVQRLADEMLTEDNIAAERAYLERPGAAGFERPYGWAWLLALHGTCPAPYRERLAPLAHDFAALFKAFLPRLTYPIRTGTHFNTAFACVLAHDWAREHDADLVRLIADRTTHWFGTDRAALAWEPGGDDFLSGTLTEALLMSRVLPDAEFADWFDAFLPDIAADRPATLLTPATVSDRTDGKIAHLDGLNLSRAWCWREIGVALPEGHPVRGLSETQHARHLAAGLPHIAGDYAGEHWLATFALLALQGA
ncbi:MAG: DUF2891 domain-containing protein [Pacificimonas sp.]